MEPSNNQEEEMKEMNSTEDIVKRVQSQLQHSNRVLKSTDSFQKEFIENKMNLMKQSNVEKAPVPKEKSDFVNVAESHISKNKPADRIFDDVCSICSSPIYYEKYICCICLNCIICPFCEREHFHPLLKCVKYMDTIKDVFGYITANQMKNEKQKKLFGGLFEGKISLLLSTLSTEFSMRPNKKKVIPIRIENRSKDEVSDRIGLSLISRNSKDLIVHDTSINHPIRGKETIECEVLIESNTDYKRYNFNIELYAHNGKIESNPLTFDLEVNKDDEDEELNEYFSNYTKFLVLSKPKKKAIKSIMEQNILSDQPFIIMSTLDNCNWDMELAISQLKGREEKNLII